MRLPKIAIYTRDIRVFANTNLRLLKMKRNVGKLLDVGHFLSLAVRTLEFYRFILEQGALPQSQSSYLSILQEFGVEKIKCGGSPLKYLSV